MPAGGDAVDDVVDDGLADDKVPLVDAQLAGPTGPRLARLLQASEQRAQHPVAVLVGVGHESVVRLLGPLTWRPGHAARQ